MDHQAERLDHLLQLLCDERLEERDVVELKQLLETSELAQRRYVETLQMCITLAAWSRVEPTPEPSSYARAFDRALRDAIVPQTDESGASQVHPFEARTARGSSALHFDRVPLWRGSFWRRFVFAASVATLALVTTFAAWHYLEMRNGVFSKRGYEAGALQDDNIRPRGLAGTFIARVVEVSADARWADGRQPVEFLMRLRTGDSLQLLAGVAHLEYYSGARIILQGPAEFRLIGPAEGALDSGRLTGKVEEGDFWLTTPTAKVIDLGTEFGVTVDAKQSTDVCVFDGEVQVRPRMVAQDLIDHPYDGYHLTRGMSVRVASDGIADGMTVGVDRDVYLRSFPSQPAASQGELDLVDVFCGGDGQGLRLAAAIDPLTGGWDKRPWDFPLGPGTRFHDLKFHRADWHPYVDGTFIPNPAGDKLQVDSLGGTLKLPKSGSDFTWGPLWARRAMPATELDRSVDFWGTETNPGITERLSRSRFGGIGIHPVVGLTFDLQAIANAHSAELRHFKGILTNLENSQTGNPEWAKSHPRPDADFFVFVDGELRFEVRDFGRNVEGKTFDVLLKSSDRYLTLVALDGGEGNLYDHLILIDPILEFTSSANAFASLLR